MYLGATVEDRIVKQPARFGFGKNWARFLNTLDQGRIVEAEKSLRFFLGCTDLKQKRFLDIGSGSGLFSLAAMRSGAERVVSFDYDANSVRCTQTLKDRFFPSSSRWVVQQASALDAPFMQGLGVFDVVYSWGVLHHTGDMWKALDYAGKRVAPGGKLYIAIYNDQGKRSVYWKKVKQLYNQLPVVGRPVLAFACGIFVWGPTFVRDTFRHANPLYTWNTYAQNRGMSPWYDLVDWVGGYPFEVAKPERISGFYRERGFVLEKQITCGTGYGCNEFLFNLPLSGAR